MSRYRVTREGKIAFRGSEREVEIDLDSARSMVIDLEGFATKTTNRVSAAGYQRVAEELRDVIGQAEGRR